MHYYKFTADWKEEEDQIEKLIYPFNNKENCAVLFNSNPEINTVYIATERIYG